MLQICLCDLGLSCSPAQLSKPPLGTTDSIPWGGLPYAGAPAKAVHSGCEILSTLRFLALWPAIPSVASQQANKTIGDNHVFMIY